MLARFHRLLALLLILLIGCTSLHAAEDDARADDPPLVGQSVNIVFRSGRELKNVVVEDVAPGKIDGTIARLKIRNPATGSQPILGASAIKSITDTDGKSLFVFVKKLRCLVPLDAEKLAEVRRQVEADARSSAARRSPSRTGPGRSRRRSAAYDREREEQEREEFYKKTGVRLWPRQTEEELAAGLAETKGKLEKVVKKFASLNMQLHETQHYLFLTDMPPQAATLYTSCLDKMHTQLCNAFGIDDKEGVWIGGKAPVIAFTDNDDFVKFEKIFFRHDVPATAQGLAHQKPSGEVVISCHCGKDPYYFASVIVHESTHGFVHRYKSPQIVPNWLNEGIAEWVALNVVPNNRGVQQKVKMSLEQMRQTGMIGPDFFTAKNIAANQYGTATAMVNFMLSSNPKAFRAMIDDIKSGESWEDAMKKAYDVTPEQFTQAFGKVVVGIPILRM